MKAFAPTILVVLLLVVTNGVAAVDTPWVLGDEASVACYTLASKEDIPRPVGLEMHWTEAPPAPLDSTASTPVKYWARVEDKFWTHPTNIALLGTDYSKYYRLCLNETSGCDSNGDCCIWHSNVHSCRAEAGACEPWVGATNATATDGSQYTLVTHTASLAGGMEVFEQHLQLDEGDWIIIAHVKIMNFQCAVGATRISREPMFLTNDNKPYWVIPVVLLVVIVAALVGGYFYKKWAATAACPTDEKKPFTVMFVGLKNEVQLGDCFPETISDALANAHGITKRACEKHNCYLARRMGNVNMIVSKDRSDALACASRIVKEFEQVDWSPYFDESKGNMHTLRRKDSCVKSETASNRSSRSQKSQKSGVEGSKRSTRKQSVGGGSKRSGTGSVHSVNLYSAHGQIDLILQPNIGLWHGLGTIVYEQERNSYSYSGLPVDCSAEITDSAKGNQILCTLEFVDECEEDNVTYTGNFSTFGSKAIRAKQRTTYELQQYTPLGLIPQKYRGKKGGGPSGDESEAEDEAVVGTISSALEISAGGLTTRRAAVAVIFAPELRNQANQWGSEVHADKVTKTIKELEAIAHNYKGDIISVTDGRIVVACNAITACSAAPSRVAHIAVEAMIKLKEMGLVKCSSGIAAGPCVVGVLQGEDDRQLKVISGSVFERACVYQNVAVNQNIAVATSQNVAKDLNTIFYTQTFDFITWPEAPHQVIPVVGVMEARGETGEDEWMYQLENSDATNPYRHINLLFAEVEKGCQTEGAQRAAFPEPTTEFLSMCAGGTPVPEDMQLIVDGAGAKNIKAVLALTTQSELFNYAQSRTQTMQLSV